MEKLFHSTFDFFCHALPGTIIVLSPLFLGYELNSSKDFLTMANQIQIGSAILIIALGYIIGFAIYPIGRFLYKSLGFLIWKRKIHEDIDQFISDKYVTIREFSPSNFKYVETWNMFCAMAHNLAVASLLIFLMVVLKIILFRPNGLGIWIGVTAALIILFFIFLHRAVVFSIWAANDINATIKLIGKQNGSHSPSK